MHSVEKELRPVGRSRAGMQDGTCEEAEVQNAPITTRRVMHVRHRPVFSPSPRVAVLLDAWSRAGRG